MDLLKLTADDIMNKECPMSELLENSCFYPACGGGQGTDIDGRPLKFCAQHRSLGIDSFVFCDFNVSEQDVLRQLNQICGYHIIAHRSLRPEEYLAKDWKLLLEPNEASKYKSSFLGHKNDFPPFGHWAVFERNSCKSELHGPERISLVFIGGDSGEGLATFQNLYVSRNIAPSIIFFLQCFGFSGNWTDFCHPSCSFAYTLRLHPECIPLMVGVGDYKHIHGVQRILKTDNLGIKYSGYDLFPQKGIRIKTSAFLDDIRVLEHDNRQFLKYSVSHDLWPIVYDISKAKYDALTLVSELTLHEDDALTPSDILNEWVGFKAPERYANGRNFPRLALDIMYRSDCFPSYVDDAMTIVGAVRSLVVDKNVKFYTDRMMCYLKDALRILTDATKQEYNMLSLGLTIKFQQRECDKLIQHLEQFCTKVI